MRLFDSGLCSSLSHLVPVVFDFAALREQARTSALPPILDTLVGRVRRTAHTDSSANALHTRIADLDIPAQLKVLTDLVRTEAAVVLGGSAGIGASKAFRDAGFDSLTAVELRNRLGEATGLKLPATLVFDFPNPAALTEYLRTSIASPAQSMDVALTLTRIEAALFGMDDVERTELADRLRDILRQLGSHTVDPVVEKIEAASDSEMFDFIDTECGTTSL